MHNNHGFDNNLLSMNTAFSVHSVFIFDSTESLEVHWIHFDSDKWKYKKTVFESLYRAFSYSSWFKHLLSCIMHTLLGHYWVERCGCCCFIFICAAVSAAVQTLFAGDGLTFCSFMKWWGKTQSEDSPREVITFWVFLRLRHSDQTIHMHQDRRCRREGLVPVDPLYLAPGAELHVSCLSTCMFYTASPGAAASPRNSCICLWLTCRE